MIKLNLQLFGGRGSGGGKGGAGSGGQKGGKITQNANAKPFATPPSRISTSEDVDRIYATAANAGGAIEFEDGFAVGVDPSGVLVTYGLNTDVGEGKAASSTNQFIKFYNKHAKSGILS